MQNEFVGKYANKYFVSAWEQKGNFKVTKGNTLNWGGKKEDVNKDGGNVVTYFCTPEGRVIHFVSGPVEAPQLLYGMQWAVHAYSHTLRASKTELAKQKRTLSRLHTRSVGNNDRMERGRHQTNNDGSYDEQTGFAAELSKMARQLSGEIPITEHRYLAYHTLAPLRDIEREVFYRFVDDDVRTEADERELKYGIEMLAKYRENREPALLVITPYEERYTARKDHGGSAHGGSTHDSHGADKWKGGADVTTPIVPGSNLYVPPSMAKGVGYKKFMDVRSEFGVVRLSRNQLPSLSARLTAGNDFDSDSANKAATARARKWFTSTLGDGPQVYVLDHRGQLVASHPVEQLGSLATAMRRVLQQKYVRDIKLQLDPENHKGGDMKLVRKKIRRLESWSDSEEMKTAVDDFKTAIRQRGEAARAMRLARRQFRKDQDAGRPQLEEIVADFPGTPAAVEARELLDR